MEALQAKLAAENALPGHEVMVTAGANQAFVNIVLTLLDAGDRAVLFRPYYFNHLMALQVCLWPSCDPWSRRPVGTGVIAQEVGSGQVGRLSCCAHGLLSNLTL